MAEKVFLFVPLERIMHGKRYSGRRNPSSAWRLVDGDRGVIDAVAETKGRREKRRMMMLCMSR